MTRHLFVLANVADRVARFAFLLAAYVTLPAMAVIISANVVMRYAFSSPLSWGAEVTQLLLIASISLAFAHASLRNVHVRMDLIYELMADRLKRVIDRLSLALRLGFFLFLAIGAYDSMKFAYEIGLQTDELALYSYLIYAVLLAICGLVIITTVSAFFPRRSRSDDISPTGGSTLR